ncbi:MAG: hypothetical protein U5M23_03300 [Marinagarivorans sp.]|nr:hypothetical protein [Marinagarivorans sp.]
MICTAVFCSDGALLTAEDSEEDDALDKRLLAILELNATALELAKLERIPAGKELTTGALDFDESELDFDESELDFDESELDFDESVLDFDESELDFDESELTVAAAELTAIIDERLTAGGVF